MANFFSKATSKIQEQINNAKSKIEGIKSVATDYISSKSNSSSTSDTTTTSETTTDQGTPKVSDTVGNNGKPGTIYQSTNTLATWQSSNNRISGGRNQNIDASLFHTTNKIRNIETLDAFYRITQTLGSQQLALSNNLYGINHQGIKGVIPDNHDSYGLVFFTRPMLNLTSNNIRNIRQMYSLLTTKEFSMQNYVRNMLDPRLMYYNDEAKYESRKAVSYTPDTKMNDFAKDLLEEDEEGGYRINSDKIPAEGVRSDVYKQALVQMGNANAIEDWKQYQLSNTEVSAYKKYLQHLRNDQASWVSCPLVDNKMAFIPILTNTIKEMSGWPDYTIGTFTSKEGLMREQWSIVDSYMEIYSAFDLDCTFRNIKDEPLVIMFETWLRYMANVFEGMLSPYMDMLVENEIDYNTRIYRLVLDESKTIVKKIAACGAAFPVNVPNSRFFDYNDSQKYNDSAKDINIRFKAMGAMYNDDILVHEFNQTVAIFNEDLRGLVRNGIVPDNYVEIPYNLIHLFNHRGYPIIDKNTLQLKWFINKNSKVYQELYNYYLT